MRKALHECCAAGCHTLTRDRYCERHSKYKERSRLSPSKRGYNAEWRRARLSYLAEHPLCECEECKRLGRELPAEVVDHIIPHKGDKALFWDRNNWQAMNKRCHDRKTAREDGGFGNSTPYVKKF